jgi:hypothetical protein
VRSILLPAAAIAAAALLPVAPAAAETLRCNGLIAAEGDSRLSVVYKCGEPVMKDSFCAPVIDLRGGTLVPPAAYGWAGMPCQMVEEWLYDRGPGHLMARVRILAGTVLSIRYSRAPE